VTHLRKAYEKLEQRLEKNGRESWIDEEMATLTAPDTYAQHPELAFRRIKVRGSKPRFLAVLREVAAWRETEARRRDMPRARVMRDEALGEIAHHNPATPADLARTRGLGHRFAGSAAGAEVLAAVARGLAVPEEECPQPHLNPELPRGLGPLTNLLKVLLKMKCEETGVAQKLVASAHEIDLIAAFGEEADTPALKGWRRQVFGEDGLRIRGGRTALAVHGKKLALVDVPPPETKPDEKPARKRPRRRRPAKTAKADDSN
jgi:ribonuclease D